MDSKQRQAILERFGNDEAFRKNVLEDAQKAVKDTFGVDLPFPVRVVANAAGYHIEPLLAAGQTELSDEHLELAVGGAEKTIQNPTANGLDLYNNQLTGAYELTRSLPQGPGHTYVRRP